MTAATAMGAASAIDPTAKYRHHYRPRGTARSAFTARVPELLYAGPAGTGKSRALLERLHVMALTYPGMKGLIVRKTAVTLSSTAIDTWRKFVIPEAQTAGIVTYYGGSRAEPAQYKYSNGSRIMLGGMDKPTKIMSSEYDVIYVQEAIELTVDDWESLLTRLRNGVIPYQMIMADTNPSTPTHWLKKRCDAGQTLLINARHEDNPVLFDDSGAPTDRGTAYISKLDSLTGIRHKRLRKGLWVAAEGQVWEEYDESVHVVPRKWLDHTWPIYWSVDFGFTHPFVLGCWVEDPDGRLILFRELYRTQALVEDHAARILEIVAPGSVYDPKTKTVTHGQWKEPKPRAIICDHDAEDRATLERHLGLPTIAADKRVSVGLQAVSSRLRLQPDGRPRLLFMRDAVQAQGLKRDETLREAGKPTCTYEEIPGYVWDDAKLKEQPVKIDDDGCDQTRYMVMYRDGKRGGNFRWMQ